MPKEGTLDPDAEPEGCGGRVPDSGGVVSGGEGAGVD